MNVAFVVVSHRRDAPAGMERSVAALCAGLRETGHGAVVLSADPAADGEPDVVRLRSLGLTFPCDDGTLRSSFLDRPAVVQEVERVLARVRVDVVSYVDALWGLGRLLPIGRARQVLMVHVVGHREDLRAALDAGPDAVIVPSPTVRMEALHAGYDSASWSVVPNGLLIAAPEAPSPAVRARLRTSGPVRAVARLGIEKGVLDLLAVAPRCSRTIEVALAEAGFEREPESQRTLLHRCRERADRWNQLQIRGGLAWLEVPPFLAGAAVVVVPSHRETFGLVALEAMSVGTPVVARAVGNLPNLVGPAGVLVGSDAGDDALWAAVAGLLSDGERYASASRAGIERASRYRPADIAGRWLRAATG